MTCLVSHPYRKLQRCLLLGLRDLLDLAWMHLDQSLACRRPVLQIRYLQALALRRLDEVLHLVEVLHLGVVRHRQDEVLLVVLVGPYLG